MPTNSENSAPPKDEANPSKLPNGSSEAASPIENMWRENFKRTLGRSFTRVRERAVEVLEAFEAETPVTLRFIVDDDRLFAVARTDDDSRDPVVIWNEADGDGYNMVREIWLPASVAETIGEFVKQNA